MKKILISLMHFMIVFTIVHAPIVLQYPVTNYGVAYADPTADDITDSGETTGEDTHEDCTDNTNVNTDEEYLYKPGCAFKNEASLIDKLEPKYYDILFTTFIALVFLSMLVYLRLPRDILDCPDNLSSQIAFWTANVASLVYVISEFANNAFYRSAAKEVVDYSFADTKTLDNALDWGKQLKAFDSLIELYEAQENVTISKITFSSILEAGYLTAEIADIVSLAKCDSECTVSYSAAQSMVAGEISALTTALGTYTTAHTASFLAAAATAAKTSVAACGAFLGAGQALNAYYVENELQLEALGVTYAEAKTALETGKTTAATTTFAAFGPAAAVPAILFNKAALTAEVAADAGAAGVNTAKEVEMVSISNGLATAVTGTSAACISAIAADVVTCTGQCGPAALACAPACTAWGVTAEGIVTAATTAFTSLHATIQQAYTTIPVMCCGSAGKYSGVTPTIDIVMPPGPLALLWTPPDNTAEASGLADSGFIKNDIRRVVEYKQKTDGDDLVYLFTEKVPVELVQSIFYGVSNKTGMQEFYEGLKKQAYAKTVLPKIEQGDFSEILEKVMYNLYFHQIIENIQKRKIKDPAQEARLLAYHFNQLDQKLHANRLLDLNKDQLAHMQGDLKSFFGELISSAHAEEDSESESGPWGEIIGVGAGSLLLLMASVRGFVKQTLESPGRRLILWGILMGLTALIITKNVFTLESVQKKIGILKNERKRFVNAKPGAPGLENSGVDSKAGTTYSNTTYSKQSAQTQSSSMCASISSSGAFMPASCPSKVAPGSFNPSSGFNRISGSLDPSHLKGLSSLAATAQEVASTGTTSPSSLSGANLEAVKQNNAAMRAATKKMSKMYDKKFGRSKDKKGFSFSRVKDQVRRAFQKRGVINPQTANTFAALTKDIAKDIEKDSKKEGKGEGQMRAGYAPKMDIKTPDFDFNMGDTAIPSVGNNLNQGLDVGKGKEKNLKNFVIKHNDINKNKGASIFKILSNRYILSYPKIIPEKKKAKLDLPKSNLPKSKNEQGQSQAPSKTLEDQLKNLKKK